MCTKVGDGICVDSLDHTYAFDSNGGVLSGVPSIDEIIVANFCSQNKDIAGYLGFAIKSSLVECLFSGGLPDPCPTYTTPGDADGWYSGNGSGVINGFVGIGSGTMCYSYNNVAAPTTARPTIRLPV
jgi:hypothetical protein